jgi:hypothetical protein
MPAEEREQTRKDKFMVTTKEKYYTKAQLTEMLQYNGIENVKGNKQHIQGIAQRAGIPLMYQKRKIVEGWEGKQKGTYGADSLGA